MDNATRDYTYLARDMSLTDGKPRFTGFQPANDLAADLTSSKGPIESGRPLEFVMDEMELRRRDNWPGEIGHFNISGGDILVSEGVRDLIAPLNIDGVTFFPAVLRDIYGEYIEPLYFLHIWKQQDITDFKNSEYLIPFDPARDRFHRLVRIAPDNEKRQLLAANQRDIVRLEKVSSAAVLFTKELAGRLSVANMTAGAIFYPLKDWFEGIEFQ
ncbi:MAG: hypothetical protein Q4G26_02620 [Paracoccus sp. (in: a-proteobacteria)]|nr:hypothetical protein [Paracoccus sp. (in: a-proteobacteria)]